MKQTIQLVAFLLVITGAISLQACKKEKENSNTTKTKTELITTGSWKMTAYTTSPAQDIDGDGDTETNLIDYLEACFKDDVTTFKTNGTADVNEGASKCDPGDPQTYSVPWSFTANETKLEVDSDEYTLVTLTATVLKVSYSFVDTGVTYTEEITFGH